MPRFVPEDSLCLYISMLFLKGSETAADFLQRFVAGFGNDDGKALTFIIRFLLQLLRD